MQPIFYLKSTKRFSLSKSKILPEKRLWITQRELSIKVSLQISFQKRSLMLGSKAKKLKRLFMCRMQKLSNKVVHQIT